MICTKCTHDKDPEEFHQRTKASKRGTQSWCKACRKDYDREYHKKRLPSGIRKKQQDIRRQRNREFIWDYLSDKACEDCGETDPIVLHFDHQRDKKYNVSEMSGSTSSTAKILEEMEKCEVVCANCHARRTAKQLNWYITRV